LAPVAPAALPPLLDPSVSTPLRVDRDPHAGSLVENVRARNDGHRPDWPSRMLLPARLLPSPPPAPVLTLTPRRVLPPRLERNATRLVVRWSFPAAARSRSTWSGRRSVNLSMTTAAAAGGTDVGDGNSCVGAFLRAVHPVAKGEKYCGEIKLALTFTRAAAYL